jgi:hypothetical protein
MYIHTCKGEPTFVATPQTIVKKITDISTSQPTFKKAMHIIKGNQYLYSQHRNITTKDFKREPTFSAIIST